MEQKKSSVQRVIDSLDELNINIQVNQLPDSTRTAQEAAKAVGCELGQIVKSLVFQTKSSLKPVLILTSGENQVNEKMVGDFLGEEIKFAPASFVRDQTGFAIGGVSPYGLKKELPILIDEDLLKYKIIWAAAGSHNAVFSITPQELISSTGGRVISVL
jgi:prolyl-tRNA editing enzyme YbaK/EbsC (Cys-tRNA(Pro) deacylase)